MVEGNPFFFANKQEMNLTENLSQIPILIYCLFDTPQNLSPKLMLLIGVAFA